METQWEKISELERRIGAQDKSVLIEFIELLCEKKLLEGFMLEALCDATYNNRTKLWNSLHEFAKTKE